MTHGAGFVRFGADQLVSSVYLYGLRSAICQIFLQSQLNFTRPVGGGEAKVTNSSRVTLGVGVL